MASPAPPGGGGKKILGLKPRTALISGVAILGGALVFFWWRSRSAKSTASSSSSSAGAYSDAAQLDELQTELDQLLQDQNPGGSGGATETGTTTTGTGTTTTTPPPTTTTAKTPPAKTAAPATPSARETKVTANSVTLAWAKVPDATTYRVRVTYQGKLVGAPHIVTGTSATISGLTSDHTYTFHVAAIGPGGTSAESSGPQVKTSR